MSRSQAFAAKAALGAALAAVAFGAAGGTDLGRTTTVEAVIVLVCGLGLSLAVLRLGTGRGAGTATLALFGALTVLTALSVSWSIEPSSTLEETSRTFAYLAVFATALVWARLDERSTPVLLGGVLLAAVTVCGWALVTRMFPASFAEDVLGARLAEPVGYSNALAAMGLVAIPATLWLGTRRGARALSAALAYPALGVLLLAMLLTQSRGALLGAAVVVVVWLVVVPVRLATVALIAVTGAITAPVAAWALSKDAFTEPLQPTSAREAVASDFTLMTLAMLAGLLAAGLAIGRLSARRPPSLGVRRRLGIALAVVACLLPLLGLASVSMSDRGLTDTISERVDDLTADDVAPPEGGARLGSVSSSRGGYWRQAADVFSENPVAGTGAGTFGLSSLRHREDGVGSRHAHGFVAQTMADLGVVGLLAVLALVAAWLAAAARATGFLPRRRPRPTFDAERATVIALALCPIGFGVQSLIDWTWFVPGPTVAALAAAGFVAGRGPLAALGEPSPSRPAAGGVTAGRIIAALALAVTTALCAWAVWQPERSARATDRAFDRIATGDLDAAERDARRARDIDPYSAKPLFVIAAVQAARGDDPAAYRTLERAVMEHPRDPETWLTLGRFELEGLDLPNRALETALATFRVDPYNRQAVLLRDRATRAMADSTAQQGP